MSKKQAKKQAKAQQDAEELAKLVELIEFVKGDALYPEKKPYKRNAVLCKKCGSIIESKHRHDFVTCPCGNVSVDGGLDYLKRCFQEDEGTWTELSEKTDGLPP